MEVVQERDVRETRKVWFDDGSTARNTVFHRDEAGKQTGFLVEFTGAALGAHFHHVRQFQVVVAGEGGRLGKADVPPISFHYTDPDSPYGPIVPGPGGSITFFTLRPRASRGTFYMPGSREQMSSKAGRNVVVVVPDAPAPADGVLLEQLIDTHEDGLAAYRLRLAPGAEAAGPAANGAGGQYYLLCGGSLVDGELTLDPLMLGWVEPAEEPPTLRAGDVGADVLVLQFPVPGQAELAALADELEGPQFTGTGARVVRAEVVPV